MRLSSAQRSRCSHSLAFSAAWLLHRFNTVPLLWVALNFKVRGAEPLRSPSRHTWRTELNSVPKTPYELCRKYLRLPLLLFSTSYLSSPPHHPHAHPCLLCSPNPSRCFCSLCLCPLFFPGSNQEKIWEQRLPISVGEWHSVVWVSILLFPGTSLKPVIHMEALCSPPGLHSKVSVTDISQTDPLLGHCLSAT